MVGGVSQWRDYCIIALKPSYDMIVAVIAELLIAFILILSTVLDIKRVENAIFTQCTFSQSYFMLLTNKTYQHDPQSLLIN